MQITHITHPRSYSILEGIRYLQTSFIVINYILKKGFLPTQIADSFAIASGGATFYRNRVNTYLSEGMTQKEAEARAFQDFRETSEESQQSSRPDKVSQQQASSLGRVLTRVDTFSDICS